MITSVPTSIASALIEGLNHDLPADGRALQALIPQKLIRFEDAVKETLRREDEVVDSADWGYDPEARARWRPGYGFTLSRPVANAQQPRPVRHCGMWCNKSVAKKAISTATHCGKSVPGWTI